MEFMAKDGTLYTANIYVEGWTGSVTPLTPSANPFETQEDDDDNAFVPVRYSTGYIRFIVTDMSIVDQFMTKDVQGRYLRLTSVNSQQQTVIHWQGYVQAQSFQCDWTAAPCEIEFPIISCLGVLDDVEYVPLNQYCSIGRIVKRALNSIGTTVDFATWYTPVRGSNLPHDFTSWIHDSIFRPSNVEEWKVKIGYNANQPFPGDFKTCLYVLEEVCKFFGYSLREKGASVYFVCVNGTANYQYGSMDQLHDDGSVTIGGTATAQSVALPAIVSDNNTREFLKGYGYFLINEQLEEPKDPVNFDLTQVEPKDVDANDNVNVYSVSQGTYINICDSSHSIHTDIIYADEHRTGDVMVYPNPGYGTQFIRINTSEHWFSKEILGDVLINATNFKPAVAIRSGSTVEFASFQSTRVYAGRNFAGGLALKANVKYWNDSADEYQDIENDTFLTIKIQWGSKSFIFNPSSPTMYEWATGDTTLNARIKGNVLHGGAISLYDNGVFRVVKSPDDFFFISADPSLHGTISISFYAAATGDGTTSDDMYILTDISLSAYQPNETNIQTFKDFSENLFKAQSNLGGYDVFEQENFLVSAVDDAQMADEMVLNDDMSDALDTLPEEDNVDRMASMYGEPTEQLKVDVQGVEITPFNTMTYNGNDYYIASRSVKWRDNQMRLQLQKLPEQNQS